ncbi:MAG: 50S ribosomal protein L18 [Deltaproteobacteria bacterium]|jgi:large subunit ribosomal protein L18|nr:50S ribosomal protein L18 [Deltaproteobacteria bacterium]
MTQTNKRTLSRLTRQKRVRKKLKGTTLKPRLSVFRSANHIYAQVIDDDKGVTLAAASTLTKEVKGELTGKKKSEAAKLVGKAIAQAAKEKGVDKVVFDRNGFLYHGRVKALSEGAREGGLEF